MKFGPGINLFSEERIIFLFETHVADEKVSRICTPRSVNNRLQPVHVPHVHEKTSRKRGKDLNSKDLI